MHSFKKMATICDDLISIISVYATPAVSMRLCTMSPSIAIAKYRENGLLSTRRSIYSNAIEIVLFGYDRLYRHSSTKLVIKIVERRRRNGGNRYVIFSSSSPFIISCEALIRPETDNNVMRLYVHSLDAMLRAISTMTNSFKLIQPDSKIDTGINTQLVPTDLIIESEISYGLRTKLYNRLTMPYDTREEPLIDAVRSFFDPKN